jgi:hypothetical protein
MTEILSMHQQFISAILYLFTCFLVRNPKASYEERVRKKTEETTIHTNKRRMKTLMQLNSYFIYAVSQHPKANYEISTGKDGNKQTNKYTQTKTKTKQGNIDTNKNPIIIIAPAIMWRD